MMKMICAVYNSAQGPLTSVSHLYYGGEGCPVTVLKNLKAIFPDAAMCQFYGPTENTNNTTWFKFSEPWDTPTGFMPLGHSLKHVDIVLLDDKGHKLTEPGREGEISLRGKQLMDGYLGVAAGDNPSVYVDSSGVRVYKTGDYGYFDAEGLLWFKGRKDDLVKIRGNRVSLQEIESKLLTCIGHSGHALATVAELNGFKQLVAGVSTATRVDIKALLKQMAEILPAYSVPDRLVQIDGDDLTVLSTGKIDRREYKNKLLTTIGAERA
jgi:acyl-CoA synthetase (AMP-forming)/AMP-acid ligase II